LRASEARSGQWCDGLERTQDWFGLDGGDRCHRERVDRRYRTVHPPFFTAALHVVGPQEVGSAAGLLNAVQQLGATLGVAVLGGIYLRTTGPHGLLAVQHAFWAAAALLAATALTAAVMARQGRGPAYLIRD